jgi:hypothetical protein
MRIVTFWVGYEKLMFSIKSVIRYLKNVQVNPYNTHVN